MAYRVAVEGIDGAGKETACRHAAKALSTGRKVAKIGRPVSIFEECREAVLYEDITNVVEGAREFSYESSIPGLSKVAEALHILTQAGIERDVLSTHSPDLLIAKRDMVLCPAVYAPLPDIPVNTKLQAFNAIRPGGFPEIIVYLDVEPAAADARITRRVAGGAFRQPHENPADLEILRGRYMEALPLVKEYGVEIIEIDTTPLTAEEVGSRVTEEVAKRI